MDKINTILAYESSLKIIQKDDSFNFSTDSTILSFFAKEVYRYLENNDLLFTIRDDIKEFDEDNSINQLQELYQKGYISSPIYDFEYIKDAGWKCTVKVESSTKSTN